jgi:hypothetical protein
MTEAEGYQAKAAQCQRLANMMTDPQAARELLDIGAEYAAKARASRPHPLIAEDVTEIGQDSD